ncbi:hypothetical protein MTO96_029567 [Rhipicephalus appendiculatus]
MPRHAGRATRERSCGGGRSPTPRSRLQRFFLFLVGVFLPGSFPGLTASQGPRVPCYCGVRFGAFPAHVARRQHRGLVFDFPRLICAQGCDPRNRLADSTRLRPRCPLYPACAMPTSCCLPGPRRLPVLPRSRPSPRGRRPPRRHLTPRLRPGQTRSRSTPGRPSSPQPEPASPSLELPPDNTYLLDDLARLLRSVLREPPSDESWARCEDAWHRAVDLATEAVNLPPVRAGRQRRQPNPANAEEIQRLYRRNRRRAVRLIFDGPSQTCAIPLQELQDYWGRTWSDRQADSTLAPSTRACSGRRGRGALQPRRGLPAPAQVQRTRPPGGDRLTYHHWKAVDPEARFLAALINACIHHKRTPDAWRTSRTVLIHKRGDPAVPSNWRPIALGCTAAKLYAKCLAARLQAWILEFERRFDIARSGGPDFCAALLDFTNAYGSVPHPALLDALRGAGAGSVFVDLIKDLYTDNSTCILAAEGSTEPIPILAGLRQGCPLSGLLFNLVVDPIIRAVQGPDSGHKILAYADDLTPLASTPHRLQRRIDRIEALAAPLGLSLNPAKCASVHMVGASPWACDRRCSRWTGVPIAALSDFEPQRFLGRPGRLSPLNGPEFGHRLRHRPGAGDPVIDVGAVAASGRAPDLCLPGR